MVKTKWHICDIRLIQCDVVFMFGYLIPNESPTLHGWPWSHVKLACRLKKRLYTFVVDMQRKPILLKGFQTLCILRGGVTKVMFTIARLVFLLETWFNVQCNCIIGHKMSSSHLYIVMNQVWDTSLGMRLANIWPNTLYINQIEMVSFHCQMYVNIVV